MNFVKLYIGDYLRDTGTLTLAQHGAYTLMLLEFYATEKPLPEGRELHRLLRADSKAERDAIDFVAAKFWKHEGGGLVNKRGLHEIERADHQRAVNREIGKRGGRPKRTEQITESVSESEPKAEPNRNPNQTPDTRQHNPPPPAGVSPPSRRPKAKAIEAPPDVTPQVWDDWTALRRAKNAPVTATVLDGARAEAAKAAMTLEAFLRVWCTRGTQGLQADWLKPHERQQRAQPQQAEPAWRTEQRDRMREFVGADLVNPAPQRQTAEVIDVTPRLVG